MGAVGPALTMREIGGAVQAEVDSIAADSSSAPTQTDGKKVKKKKARVSVNAAPAPSVPPPELQPRVRAVVAHLPVSQHPYRRRPCVAQQRPAPT